MLGDAIDRGLLGRIRCVRLADDLERYRKVSSENGTLT
jgi:hypothetical protein